MIIRKIPSISAIISEALIIKFIPALLILLFGVLISQLSASENNNKINFQDGTVTGTVTDARNGEPLTGANVLLEGADLGTSVGVDGNFEFTDVQPGSYLVLVRFIGYQDYETEIAVEPGEVIELDISLSRETVGLDDIVVTATGDMRSREIGTSQARVTAREFQGSASRNPQEIITGRITGATVLSNSGQPGAGGTIRLRGNNSISQSNNPIIYVDGIRIDRGTAPQHPASRQNTSSLNDINPNDIESIDVVKGAAATTLYGTEASGGVIRITTKQGVEGVTRWDASVSSGINNLGTVGPRNDNPAGLFLGECSGENLVNFRGERFQEVSCPENGSWLQNGLVQRYNLSVSSGVENFTYFISANLNDEQGVINGGGGTRGAGFRGNFRFVPVENITVSFNSSYNNNRTDWVPEGSNGDAFLLNVSRGPGGNFSGAAGCDDPSLPCTDNGEILRATNTTVSDHYINSLVIETNTRDKLTNRLTFGFDYNSSELEEMEPFGYARNPQGQQTIVDWEKTVLSLEYLGTYLQPISQNLRATFNWGGQLFRDRNQTTTMASENFSGPQTPTLTSGARTSITSDSRITVTTGGFFGQAMFDYRDQLFVTGGLRVDGHSAFGDDFGLQTYPKISASYVLSDFEFWPTSWWNTMRIRAAVGESGQAPGAFDAVRTWSPIAGDDGQPGFTPNQIGNPELGPERSQEFETGFTASFLDGQLNLDLTYYNQKTTDALIPVPAIASQGFLSSQVRNIGEIKSSGIELDVDLDLIRSTSTNWNIRFGYSKENNEAVDLGGIDNITVQFFGRSFIREGYPVPAVFGAKVSNPDEFANPEYEEDQFYGPNYPDQSFTIGSTLQFGDNITIDALGEFKWGGYMINGTGYQNSRRGIWSPCFETQSQSLENLTASERARCALNGTEVTPRYDNWIESTDFFKLRHISFTYTLPQRWLPGGIQNSSFNFAARNLFTLTSFEGVDPEADDYRWSIARRDYYNMPTYRTFIGTLNFSF